ncbi:cell division protein SepF [Skermania piniformis]|uniref:Cell division protein SepF n=1 Tax=Skermania pinensis TaxID=39122 RepID=A0ABX8SD77_9ACTN|nr:cell division protein SepF [Skermania piniformis]QXQ15102.1 cell division protein SepF [Skermania piniformis]
MSTLHKFKAYFGMVPLDDYEDDYLDEPLPRRAPRPVREEYAEVVEAEYREPAYQGSYAARRSSYEHEDGPAERGYEPGYDLPRRAPRSETARLDALPQRAPRVAAPVPRVVTRGALAVETRIEERRPAVDDGGPLSKITTLRPRDYTEACTIGERFRDGSPVIMDLVELSNADAKRLVDFAAGLAFALRGSFDKVATKVFLLSPADIDVSAEDRRRIAETGFYSQ